MNNRASTITGNTSRAIERHLGSSYKTILYIAGRIPWLEDFLSAIDDYLGGYLGDYEDFPTETPKGEELVKGMFFVNTVDTYIYFYIGEGQWTSVYDQVVLGKSELDNAVTAHLVNLEQATSAHLLTLDTAATDNVTLINNTAASHILVMDGILSDVTVLATNVEAALVRAEQAATDTEAARAEVEANAIQTALDVQTTTADRTQTQLDVISTAADALSANDSQIASEASEANTESYKNAAEASNIASGVSAIASEASAVRAENAASAAESALIPRGDWDASGGVFPIPTMTPERADFYQISVGGTMTDANPAQDDIEVSIGDNLYWSMPKDIWYKIDNTSEVFSVQGRKGNVVITKTDVELGLVSNLAISDVYSSDGINYASRTALFNAYTALNNSKLGVNATSVAAQKWATARTFQLTGGVTGSVDIDGSGNVSMAVNVTNYSHGHTIANVVGLQDAIDVKVNADVGVTKISPTAPIDIQKGTTATRPDTSSAPNNTKALFWYNETTEEYEVYNPATSEWGAVGGGGVTEITLIDPSVSSFDVKAGKIYGIDNSIYPLVVANVPDTFKLNDWFGIVDIAKMFDHEVNIGCRTTLSGSQYYNQLDEDGNQTQEFDCNNYNGSYTFQMPIQDVWVLPNAVFGQDAEWAVEQIKDNAIGETTEWVYVGAVDAPPFLNSWANFDSGYSVARYRKLNGVVYIEGVVANGPAASSVFTLPEGFRPSLIHMVCTIGGTNIARIDINPSGNVEIPTTQSNAYVSLHCSFSLID